jgi:hypothetical protein
MILMLKSTITYLLDLRILEMNHSPKYEPTVPIISPTKNWIGARNPKKIASAYPCLGDTEMGTARILATSIEYANAMKVDNRRALNTLSRSESNSPATKELNSAETRPISQPNPKSRIPRD